VYSFSWSGASEESCGVVGTVHSSDGGPVIFRFLNNMPNTLTGNSVWIDEIATDGNPILEAPISYGDQYTASTNVGVYFVVYYAESPVPANCQAVFDVTGPGQVTINLRGG
jgi:hypothetical protein